MRLSRLLRVALSLSSMGAATIPCYRASGFDPYKSLTFLPNASRGESEAATDGRARQASAAWRELAEGAGRRCLLDCRASIGGNRNGYGSYLNSVLGSVRSVMKDLGALPAPHIRLPRSLEPALRPAEDALFATAACAAGSPACFSAPSTARTNPRRARACATAARRASARAARRACEQLLRAGSPFWNVAEATRRLLQPARAPRGAARGGAPRSGRRGARATHDALAAPRPRLAMHIRRGDACNHDAARTGRTCGPVRAYADAAAELAARYGFRSLIVASDWTARRRAPRAAVERLAGRRAGAIAQRLDAERCGPPAHDSHRARVARGRRDRAVARVLQVRDGRAAAARVRRARRQVHEQHGPHRVRAHGGARGATARTSRSTRPSVLEGSGSRSTASSSATTRRGSGCSLATSMGDP